MRHEPRGKYHRRADRRKWVDTTHPGAVHGPNFKPSRVKGTYLLLQFIRVREGVVAEIHVALKGKRELAIDKPPRRGLFMIEPMEYGFEWIQSLIEGEHRFRRETVVMHRHLRWWGSGSVVRVRERRDCGRGSFERERQPPLGSDLQEFQNLAKISHGQPLNERKPFSPGYVKETKKRHRRTLCLVHVQAKLSFIQRACSPLPQYNSRRGGL